MASRTTTQQQKQEEPNIMLEVPYGTKLVLPARMAGEFLPYVRCVEEKYDQAAYHYRISDESLGFKLLSADTMTAAMVTAALTTGG